MCAARDGSAGAEEEEEAAAAEGEEDAGPEGEEERIRTGTGTAAIVGGAVTFPNNASNAGVNKDGPRRGNKDSMTP